MSTKLPIKLLETELISFEHSLQKSIECHNLDKTHPRYIDDKTHMMHRENLEPLISKYKIAIQILRSCLVFEN
jgi:hypothetical protein